MPRQISAISTLIGSARSSSSERFTSFSSEISSAQRIGRRLSDISLGSADKLNYSAKRQVTFSPIHEHSEEASDSHVKEIGPVGVTISLDPSSINGPHKFVDADCLNDSKV